ncbi:MAG: DUF547 domain-containing protein [Nitrospiraceae bacterium]|nr:MAG: DUF547 domain-containing protein [Nitrospiraceae bacterium]
MEVRGLKRLFFTAVVLTLSLSLHCVSYAAPKSKLWDYWLPHDPASVERIDHAVWNRFLKTYVVPGEDGINRVNYGNVSKADHENLKDYITSLSRISVRALNRAEQQAYWINLYNALTVDVILDHYPVKSIRDIDISPGWFADGPWRKKLLTIEGMAIAIDDIEHRILRPIWEDPKIHYAVNCAAIACPNLQVEAFTAENTEELLNKGAKEYVNHKRGVTIEDNKLKVSSIYKWFISDFGGNDEGVINHLKEYANRGLISELEKIKRISSHDYDWALNGAEGKK